MIKEAHEEHCHVEADEDNRKNQKQHRFHSGSQGALLSRLLSDLLSQYIIGRFAKFGHWCHVALSSKKGSSVEIAMEDVLHGY